MKLHLCLKLAVRNIVNQKKIFINMLIGFGIISFIITSNVLYLKVIDNSIRNMEQNTISKNYLTLKYRKNDIPWNLLNSIKNIDGVCDVQISTDDSLSSYTKKNDAAANVNGHIAIDETCLQIGNDLYYGKSISDITLENKDFTFQEMNLRCDVNFMIESYSLISSSEIREYKNKYGKNELPFIYGTEPVSANEIALSDYFLNRYSISKESFMDLIGSNITILYLLPDGSIQLTLKDVKLTGIIDSRFFTISSRKNTPQVLATLDQSFPFDDYRIKIFLESYNGAEEKKVLVDNVLNTSTNYDASNITIRKNLYMQKNVILLIFTLIFIVLIVAGIVYIFNIYLYYFFERKYYIGITKAVGLSNKSIGYILLFELFIPNFISILFGGIISFFVINFFLGQMYPIIGTDYIVEIVDFIQSVAIALCVNIAISLLMIFFIKVYINRNSILELMQ